MTRPAVTWIRSIDVAAPAPRVFRWLCQLRIAAYSYDWLDQGGRRSPRVLTPGLENLAPGQEFMKIFRLESFAVDRHITLALASPARRRAVGDLVVTYAVEALGTDRCRLTATVTVPSKPGFFWRLMIKGLEIGDGIMMRKQLRTVRALAIGESAKKGT